jgi:hypothetical protein
MAMMESALGAEPALVFLPRRMSWVVGVDLGQASDPTAIAVLEHIKGVLGTVAPARFRRHRPSASMFGTCSACRSGLRIRRRRWR